MMPLSEHIQEMLFLAIIDSAAAEWQRAIPTVQRGFSPMSKYSRWSLQLFQTVSIDNIKPQSTFL